MRHLLVVALLCLGCGGSSVKLRFDNGLVSGSQGLQAKHQGLGARAPSTFGMKLIAVYLAEDVDPVTQNNRGLTEMIYLNPACESDISRCELSPGFNETDGVAFTHFVTDYFDFAADSATVNTGINAQQLTIPAGTYRYARMEFCKRNQGQVPNLRWADAARPEVDVVWGGCGVTSAAFAEPMVVGAGDALAVTLGYDLSTSVTDLGPSGQVTGMSCDEAACFSPPAFVPSAAKLTP